MTTSKRRLKQERGKPHNEFYHMIEERKIPVNRNIDYRNYEFV